MSSWWVVKSVALPTSSVGHRDVCSYSVHICYKRPGQGFGPGYLKRLPPCVARCNVG